MGGQGVKMQKLGQVCAEQASSWGQCSLVVQTLSEGPILPLPALLILREPQWDGHGDSETERRARG